MQENRDTYFIAALIDGEIKDPAEEKRLRDEMEGNADLRFEYFVQSSVKNLVSTRLGISPAPAKVRKKLERKISPASGFKMISKFLPEIYFTRPVIAWGSAAVLIIAVILLIFNLSPHPVYKNFAAEQKGSTNMYIQARINFKNILTGDLTPQFTSDNPASIMEFFKEKGVRYPTFIPEIKGWHLIGAVVSVDHGEKFAHHVYSTPGGKLVYLFQVKETDIKSHEFLTLTDDLISYLDSGKCYECEDGSLVTLFRKVKGNIFAVVSNDSPVEIENNICQLN